MLVDHLAKFGGKAGQTLRKIKVGIRLDHAMRHPAETGAIDSDDSPAGMAQAGIDAQDSNHLVHSGKFAGIERIENTPEVNRAETNAAELAHMRFSAPSLTRRAALRLGLAGAGALVAPQALAAPAVSFPMRIACVRVSPEGFLQIRSDEQDTWQAMAVRLGGLIETLMPLQPTNMLGGGLPKVDGAASCALVARQMATAAGYSQVILYSTMDGQKKRETYDNWFAQTFHDLLAQVGKDDRAVGEAHLLDVSGGMPLASAMADAKPRDPLNLFDGGRNPEREVLLKLVQQMERRLQDMARNAYENQRSIAD